MLFKTFFYAVFLEYSQTDAKIIERFKEECEMSHDKLRGNSGNSEGFHPLLEEYRRKERIESECITGSRYLDENPRRHFLKKRNKALYLATQLMFLLGLIIALILYFD